jgi:hypothetical protein
VLNLDEIVLPDTSELKNSRRMHELEKAESDLVKLVRKNERLKKKLAAQKTLAQKNRLS